MNWPNNLIARTVLLLVAATGTSTAAFSQSVADLPAANPRLELAPQAISLPYLVERIADQEFNVKVMRMMQERLGRRHDELLKAREQSNAVQDALNVSSASFDEVLRLLQTQRVLLTIDLAGLEARLEAMTSAAKGPASETGPGGNEIVGRLVSLVELERDRLQHAQELHEKGASSQGDLNLARQCLINAEIRLAEARSGLANNSASPNAPELTALMLDRAEKAARLAKVSELSAEMLKARGPVESAAQLNEQLRHTNTELNAAHDRISDSDAQLEAYRKALHDLQQRTEADDPDDK